MAGGAEALRAKPLSANPISITSADLRKPSTATTISMTGIENSAAGGGAAPLMDGIDGHMPHLICKPWILPQSHAKTRPIEATQ